MASQNTLKLRTPIAVALVGSALVLLSGLFMVQHWTGARMLLIAGAMVLAAGLVSLALTLVRHGRRQEQRIALMQAQRVEQEREIAELRIREQVSRDMHDDLGAGLSALRLRSELALRTETDPQRREVLMGMAEQAGELIGNMRQLIWAISEGGDLSGTLDHLESYTRTYLTANGLHAEILREGDPPLTDLEPGQRRHLLMILKEALHNVVKHASADHVRVRLAWIDGLRIEVQDDGVGMVDEDPQNKGRGLLNMRERARELGGTLQIATQAGTCITIAIPEMAVRAGRPQP